MKLHEGDQLTCFALSVLMSHTPASHQGVSWTALDSKVTVSHSFMGTLSYAGKDTKAYHHTGTFHC